LAAEGARKARKAFFASRERLSKGAAFAAAEREKLAKRTELAEWTGENARALQMERPDPDGASFLRGLLLREKRPRASLSRIT
jgi:pyridoxine/pyridoxamine 5'-phosphate oxidase